MATRQTTLLWGHDPELGVIKYKATCPGLYGGNGHVVRPTLVLRSFHELIFQWHITSVVSWANVTLNHETVLTWRLEALSPTRSVGKHYSGQAKWESKVLEWVFHYQQGLELKYTQWMPSQGLAVLLFSGLWPTCPVASLPYLRPHTSLLVTDCPLINLEDAQSTAEHTASRGQTFPASTVGPQPSRVPPSHDLPIPPTSQWGALESPCLPQPARGLIP